MSFVRVVLTERDSAEVVPGVGVGVDVDVNVDVGFGFGFEYRLGVGIGIGIGTAGGGGSGGGVARSGLVVGNPGSWNAECGYAM